MVLSVALVLMIVCVNVASLLLARAAGRRHEFAIRAAIGAGTSRLIRQALTESIVMSIPGGLAGTAIAAGAVHFIVVNAPAGLPRVNEIHYVFRRFSAGTVFESTCPNCRPNN